MLGPGDLVLCAGTLPAASFRERAEAAAAAGFTALSLLVTDHARARAEGLSDGDLRAILADRGLAVAEIDPLMSWIPGAGLHGSATDEGAALFRVSEDDFYAAAAAVGARSLNAVAYTAEPLPRDALAEHFAGLCDRARERGLLVHLEFLPWTQVPHVAAALDVVERAGRQNGGVMLDAWHHFRGGGGAAELSGVPGSRILGVQLDDAPREAEADPVEETLRRRLLPGEGDIDLVGLVRALDAIGCSAPIGVEVFSDALAALPAAEVAKRAGDALRGVIAEARAR